MEALLTDLMTWVHAHPHWAGLFVLVVSALESLLVVGLFVPGSVVMFGLGAMIAAGSMDLLPTLIWATLGAVLGDGSSYFIGRHYHQRLRVIWPFRKYPQMIARGVDFFHKHGGKSIFLARFVGPVRPLLPAVAGMLDMPARRFFLFNTSSALLWSPAYIMPGVLFGASLGVVAEIAGHLALLLALLVALLWFSWWLMRRLTRSLQPHAQALQLLILDRARAHRWLYPLAASLLDPQHPEARGMTVLTLLLLVASWSLLVLLPGHSAPGSWLGNLDLYIYYQLQSLRAPLGDRLLVFVSGLGSAWVLYGFTALMSLWLLWRRHWRVTLHWWITVGAVGALSALLRHFTQIPRPPAPLDTSVLSYSFPSDHASVSLAVFGFLAVAIARELRSNWHWIPYSSAVFLVVAISFSRLYLGVQWFSDILGGWSLGLVWVALLGIAYRQHPAERIPAREFAPIGLAALILTAGLYTHQRFEAQVAFYKPRPSAEILMTRDAWLAHDWRILPVYRDDFIGRHNHPLDIQWLGSRQGIETTLQGRGWHPPQRVSSLSLFDLFNSDVGLDQLPVLPQVHRGENQQILLVRPSGKPGHLLTLRLWRTEYRLSGSNKSLWVGSISYLYVDERFRVIHFLRTDADYRDALRDFAPAVAGLNVHRVQRHADQLQPSASRWSGGVWLIDGD